MARLHRLRQDVRSGLARQGNTEDVGELRGKTVPIHPTITREVDGLVCAVPALHRQASGHRQRVDVDPVVDAGHTQPLVSVRFLDSAIRVPSGEAGRFGLPQQRWVFRVEGDGAVPPELRVRRSEDRFTGCAVCISPRHVAAAGADLLIHECFQSPAVYARATGLPLETALNITRLAHTIPDQMGKILDLTRPRMGALWHLDVTPGVDGVLDELSAHYDGPVTVTQDFIVFNVTDDAVVARQAKVNDAAPPVHGPSQTSPTLDPSPTPPAWWAEALLDL